MDLLIVNGKTLKSPTAYSYKLADIDSSKSGRTESGVMTREVVRKKVVSITVGFDNISTAEQQAIVSAVNPDFVTVQYYDGVGMKTATMYTAELDFNLVSVDSDLWNVSFQLAEQ